MWIPKGAPLITGRHLFEARRLLEEIRYFKKAEIRSSKKRLWQIYAETNFHLNNYRTLKLGDDLILGARIF